MVGVLILSLFQVLVWLGIYLLTLMSSPTHTLRTPFPGLSSICLNAISHSRLYSFHVSPRKPSLIYYIASLYIQRHLIVAWTACLSEDPTLGTGLGSLSGVGEWMSGYMNMYLDIYSSPLTCNHMLIGFAV